MRQTPPLKLISRIISVLPLQLRSFSYRSFIHKSLSLLYFSSLNRTSLRGPPLFGLKSLNFSCFLTIFFYVLFSDLDIKTLSKNTPSYFPKFLRVCLLCINIIPLIVSRNKIFRKQKLNSFYLTTFFFVNVEVVL